MPYAVISGEALNSTYQLKHLFKRGSIIENLHLIGKREQGTLHSSLCERIILFIFRSIYIRIVGKKYRLILTEKTVFLYKSKNINKYWLFKNFEINRSE